MADENRQPKTIEDLSIVWPPDGPDIGASAQVQVDIGARTHAGMRRATNDDYFVAGRFERRMQILATNLPAGTIPSLHREMVFGMLVADGVGGPEAAEVGSRTAAVTLIDLVLGTPDWIMRANERFLEQVQIRFAARLRWLDRALGEQARGIPGLDSMGATMTVAASFGADLIVGHVGASRAYLWRNGALMQLTRDQSRRLRAVDRPGHDGEADGSGVKRSVLTSGLGLRHGRVDVEVQHVRLADRDRVMLSTDGLTEVVDDPAIAAILGSVGSAEDAASALVTRTLKGGAPDNVTALVADYRMPSAT